MLTTNKKSGSFEKCVEWLTNSGIQSFVGGFYSWFDLSNSNYPYLYSEITGYGITTLLFLETIFHNENLVVKAEKAAEWIVKKALHPCGGVLTRFYSDEKNADKVYSFGGVNIFSFDTGMVLYGAAALYKRTGKDEYLKLSRGLADFLLKKMFKSNGSIAPVYNAVAGKCVEAEDKWSSQSGAFHAKVAMGLVLSAEITGEKKYLDAALGLCEFALLNQDPTGRFITDRASKTTHLHPHSYTAEGLWYVGIERGIAKFTEAALKAAKWAQSKVSVSGVNELYDPKTDSFNDFQRTDILAQTLRLGLIFSLKDKTEMLKACLLSYQYGGEMLDQRGGFAYSKESPHLNSWCSMFSLQALALCDDRNLLFAKGGSLLI